MNEEGVIEEEGWEDGKMRCSAERVGGDKAE